jgi:hypothetical protein
MIGPAGRFNLNIHPGGNGFYISLGGEVAMDLGAAFQTYMGINGEDQRHNPFKSNLYIAPYLMIGFQAGYDTW